MVKLASEKHQNKNVLYYLNILLIIYPVFYPAVDLFGHIGQYLLFFMWFIFVAASKPNFISDIVRSSFVYIFFMLILIIRIVYVISEVPLNFYSPYRLLSQFTLIFIYYIFGLWHSRYSSYEMRTKLVKSFLISYTISAFISLYYLFKNEYAIRQSFNYDNFAVGDFNLVYTGVCISTLLFFITMKKKKKIEIKTFLALSISSLLVIKANYATAVLLMVLMFCFSILIKYRKKHLTFLFIIIFTILMLPFSLNMLEMVILKITSLDSISYAMRVRLLDVYYMVNNSAFTDSETILTRLNLSSISWDSFISNPLLGVNYLDYNQNTIGSHTQWMDNLARFGLLGSTMFFIQLIIWFRNIFKTTRNNENKSAMIISWMVFLILGIVNNNMLGGLFICMFFLSSNLNLLSKDHNL